jgi:AraC family transcriptional regulator
MSQQTMPSIGFGKPLVENFGTRKQIIYKEHTWRRPNELESGRLIDGDIHISRWICSGPLAHRHEADCLSDRHVISVALKATRINLMRDKRVVFEGTMASSTVQVTGPSRPLTAEFLAPCDFIHLYVTNEFIHEQQNAISEDGRQPIRELGDLVIRDPVAESLCRLLIEGGNVGDRRYARGIAEALVIRTLGIRPSPQTKVNALPKWRLNNVREYVIAHIGDPISLCDMASVSGLSRMHFAAQFRAATGYSPHEYVLIQRIEQAKTILSDASMPIVEAALSTGFSNQGHFSTVFKRFTGESPGQWRRTPTGERGERDAIVWIAAATGQRHCQGSETNIARANVVSGYKYPPHSAAIADP